jgi:hypothetical protein
VAASPASAVSATSAASATTAVGDDGDALRASRDRVVCRNRRR